MWPRFSNLLSNCGVNKPKGPAQPGFLHDRRIAAKLAPIQTGEVKVTDPDLKDLGCTDLPRTASVQEIFSEKPPGDFNWTTELWSNIGLGMAFAVALALAVYGHRPCNRLGHWRLCGLIELAPFL